MSDYLRFSFAIDASSVRGRDWLLALGRFMADNLSDEEKNTEYDPSEYEIEEQDLETLWKTLSCNSGVQITSHEFENNNTVYVYADTFGNVWDACTIAQEYLKRFAEDRYITFKWVEYTDHNRIDSSDGGFCIVTSTAIYQESLQELLNDRVEEVTDGTSLSTCTHGRG